MGFWLVRGNCCYAGLRARKRLDASTNSPVCLGVVLRCDLRVAAAFEPAINDLLDQLPLTGLKSRDYWTVDAPLVSVITEIDDLKRSRVLAYSYTVFRKVNGVPLPSIALSVWVHRSGTVSYLALSGLGVSTSGDPGAEVSPLPPLKVLIPKDDLVRIFLETVHPRVSLEGIQWVDVRFAESKVGCDVQEGSDACATVEPVLGIQYQTTDGSAASFTHVATVSMETGEVTLDVGGVE